MTDISVEANVPQGTSIEATIYEDVDNDASGQYTDSEGNTYDNSETVELKDGNHAYELDEIEGASGNTIWVDAEYTIENLDAKPVIESIDEKEVSGTPTPTLSARTISQDGGLTDGIRIGAVVLVPIAAAMRLYRRLNEED